MILHARIPSPIGPLLLAADDAVLHGIWFCTSRHPQPPQTGLREGDNAMLREVRRQLDAYFAGGLQDFDLPLQAAGTAFQREVWAMLARIPYGQTWSYGELAQRIGRPAAMRAVGAANGLNPIAIVVPCHRVIGSNGTLTGYGGGLPNKKFLLDLEQKHSAFALAP